MVIEWALADTPEALKTAYHAERDRQVRTRLHGLWLLRSGWKLADAAGAVGVDYRTAQRWMAWYRAGGLAEIRGHKMGGTGNPPRLTGAQQAEVAAEVGTGRFRTAAGIREWIAARYGVAYTEGGTYSLLARLRCAPKVPRPLHREADAAAQAAWKKGASNRRSPTRG